jgi:pimeloyl-ACP methyl ester carboxylesterase
MPVEAITRATGHLDWADVAVRADTVSYGVAGDGPPLVFLHGWGLGHHSYKRALSGLVRLGMRVYAPALPGFGGTRDLQGDEFSLEGYARWVVDFLTAVGVDRPVTLVGHSFGGGVAIRTAHDAPQVVGKLVVVNSIGGSAWTRHKGVLRTMAERPLWDWGLHLQSDIWPARQLRRVVPVILEDALPNLLRNPSAMWRVGRLAARANLVPELEELKRRKLPVVVLWGDRDRVIPELSLQSLRTALGDPQVVTVPGNHSWLLSDPDGFAEVMTNVVDLASALQDATAPGHDESSPDASSAPDDSSAPHDSSAVA